MKVKFLLKLNLKIEQKILLKTIKVEGISLPKFDFDIELQFLLQFAIKIDSVFLTKFDLNTELEFSLSFTIRIDLIFYCLLISRFDFQFLLKIRNQD